jgi:pyruvate ferredoxin oxidoreductase alpha subunit
MATKNQKLKNQFIQKALIGAEAYAEAMRQIEPDVVAAYPITPQTPIIEKFAEYVSDGEIKTKFILTESEHSALSAVVGASAAGGRAMTATSSQGLAYMWEVLGVASGLRLPIVMAVANRAISAPLNIHCDHSDSMGARDLGWIQIFCETVQEVYENTLLSLRLAENPKILLPAMIMHDGFVTSHGVENVKILKDETVKNFVGEYKPKYFLLDIEHPVTFGPIVLPDYQMEVKYKQAQAIKNAKKIYLEVGKALSKITGRKYGYFEEYRLSDAKYIIVTMSSTAGTVKAAINELRARGQKVGLLKIKLFRPFPHQEVGKMLARASGIAILDRSESFGANPPLFSEIKSSLFDLKKRPKLQSYVFGIGGRDIKIPDIKKVFAELRNNKSGEEIRYITLRK